MVIEVCSSENLRVDVLDAGEGQSAANPAVVDSFGQGEEALRLTRVALTHKSAIRDRETDRDR